MIVWLVAIQSISVLFAATFFVALVLRSQSVWVFGALLLVLQAYLLTKMARVAHERGEQGWPLINVVWRKSISIQAVWYGAQPTQASQMWPTYDLSAVYSRTETLRVEYDNDPLAFCRPIFACTYLCTNQDGFAEAIIGFYRANNAQEAEFKALREALEIAKAKSLVPYYFGCTIVDPDLAKGWADDLRAAGQ